MAALFPSEAEVPLPSTLVFDGAGKLRRVFARAVTGEELEGLLTSFGEEGAVARDLVRRGRLAAERGRLRADFEAFHDRFRTAAGVLVRRPYVITVGRRIG